MTGDAGVSLEEIARTLAFGGGYQTNLVIAGATLLGFAAGVIGVFALLRKRSMTADALSHATLPGIAIAFLAAAWLGVEGRSIIILLAGAACTGSLGVVCIHVLAKHPRVTEDTAIGVVLSVFFGAGVVGLSIVQNHAPSGSGGIDAFIYGQAAAMQPEDVALMVVIALASVIATLVLLKEFTLVSFNDSFAQVTGWPVSAIDLAIMALVSVVTIAGLQAVGLIMVVALLIIPPVSARFWTDRLRALLAIAGLIGAVSGYLGSVVSASFPRLPAGSIIVLTSGVAFVISLLGAPRGVLASSARRLSLRLRLAGDHFLELAHDAGTERVNPDSIRRLGKLRGWSAVFRTMVLVTLRWSGMISGRSGADWVLTEAGVARGDRVARNHALWERYLVTHADIAPSHVDWSVDQVEHVLGSELIARLEAELAGSESATTGGAR
ncbi:MAG: iron chelate uptake ABC transporter family permease subunit [Planctomycetota bacterium]